MESKELIKFNVNDFVLVRLTDKGIEKLVNDTNEVLPLKYHTSFIAVKNKQNKKGYTEFQLWSFLDQFGGLGMRAHEYFETDIYFNK